MSRPAGVLSGCVDPHDAYWREHDLLRKLHLSDHKRIAMGKLIDSYFRVLHLEIPRLATAKVDDLALSKFFVVKWLYNQIAPPPVYKDTFHPSI